MKTTNQSAQSVVQFGLKETDSPAPELFNEETQERLIQTLLRIAEQSATKSKCHAIRYHADKELADELADACYPDNRPAGFALMAEPGLTAIFYDDSLPSTAQVGLFAHEASHIALGHLERPKRPSRLKSQDEWEADFFAAAFMFITKNALPIMESWNRQPIYDRLDNE